MSALLLPDRDQLPSIAAQRVLLRHLTADDVGALFDVFSSPEVTRYFGVPLMQSTDDARALLEQIHDCFAKRSLYQWGVSLDGTVIGTATLNHLDARNQRAELGFALGRRHWGQGYMTEALVALLDYALDSLDLRRIEADVDPRNEAALRRLERLGFQREGYAPERWLVDGELQDSVLFGLLKRDWSGAGRPR